MECDFELDRKLFIETYRQTITREGADNLLEWICDANASDFFTAPASTKFHMAKKGGLCRHSLNVYRRLKDRVESERTRDPDLLEGITDETIAITALLHDLCKVNLYRVELRNVKKDGVWEQVPYYAIDDTLPYGHGEKSVYMISGFMRLTREEAMAINWHMGGFDARVKGGDYSLSNAFNRHPFAVLAHLADIEASYLDEREGD